MKKYAVFFAVLFCMAGIVTYPQSLGDYAKDEQKRREVVPGSTVIVLESERPVVPDETVTNADGAEQNGAGSGFQISAAVNAFAIDVYRQLATEGGNLFFSPYNISSALAMAYAGAKGDTAAEMAKALRFTGRAMEIHEAMKSLNDRFNSISHEEGLLEAANGLWFDELVQIIPSYEALIRENYDAEAKTVDFSSKPKESERMINEWVALKTRHKIRDVLNGYVTNYTKMVLVSAIYFNSVWLDPFIGARTKIESFRARNGQEHDVSMMRRTGNYLYGENSEVQWVKIPYKIPGFSMLILLPRENDSFTQMAELEKKLTPNLLASWMAGMRNMEVALSMPKFKHDRSFSLTDMLQKLGVNAAFDIKKADFSGMALQQGDDRLFIDSVIHQAFIEVDEKGTEAAAATAVIVTQGAVPEPPPIEFNADHPFIYCIVDDNAGGLIMFMGRMEQP